MAFTVETGAGLSNANSFCDVAFFKTYFGDLGDLVMTAKADSDIQIALVKGTAYIEETYRLSFVGRKVYAAQALSWPRYSAHEDQFRVEPNIVPVNVKKATCEAAKRSFLYDLNKDIKPGEAGVIEKTVGPITKRWAPNSIVPFVVYPAIDKLLAGLVEESYGILKTVRS
jgi:hypothetical protein